MITGGNVDKIREMARENNWTEIIVKDPYMISFKRNGQRINVWYEKMTVGTALAHPKKGKTQLFRKHVPMGLLKKIFVNPRVHTKSNDPYRGYREKRFK